MSPLAELVEAVTKLIDNSRKLLEKTATTPAPVPAEEEAKIKSLVTEVNGVVVNIEAALSTPAASTSMAQPAADVVHPT